MRRRASNYASVWQLVHASLLFAILFSCVTLAEQATSAEWIWSPEHGAGEVPQGDCYFRKAFPGGTFQKAKFTVAGDDSFEVYLNGRRIIQGKGWKEPKSYNILPLVNSGRNVVAVKVTNSEGGAAGFAATIELTDNDGGVIEHVTDGTWKTSLRPLAFWHLPRYSDARWADAQSLGEQGKTEPWLLASEREELEQVADASNTSAGETPQNATNDPPSPDPVVVGETDSGTAEADAAPVRSLPDNHPKFRTQRDFEVQILATHDQVGSLIACEFNEFHELIISRENGPLLIMVDTNKDKIPDSPRVYCDEVKNVQGILPINGDVYVIADGPDDVALYQLSDDDKDGQLEVVRTLLKFRHASDPEEHVGEHGPHGLALGPDGNIYISVGNHATIEGEFDDASPYRTIYEGDIVQRYEDPTGHANGIKSPGGTIVRVSLKGDPPQRVAGGLRNAYDIAFDQFGNLFTYDSDMEADEGTTWYHPTRIMHIVAGGEYGWRSGWAKWPQYWHDGLPALAETGRGSPTGMVFYDHFMYPEEFQHDLIVADWTNGRILHVDTEAHGATFEGKSDTLMQGEPLTISDLAVGPDGWLYFVTGGRDTAGAVYRLVYNGETPQPATRIGEGVAAAIRYPQFQAAWSRQELAKIKHAERDRWKAVLPAIARTTKNSARFRTRALDLMHLYGPALTEELLLKVAKDDDANVRAKAVQLMGQRYKNAYEAQVLSALKDENAAVRRAACEAIVSAGIEPKLDKLQPLLTSKDRFEAFAARRVLESIDAETWQQSVLTTDDHRLFIQGGTALLLVSANKPTSVAVLERMRELFTGYVSDGDFKDMLRMAQVAVELGSITGEDVPEVATALANEFPSTNVTMNRELLRLLVALNVNDIGDRYIAYLNSDLKSEERLQVALHLALLEGGWSGDQRVALLKSLEELRQQDGGASRGGYVQNVSRQFVKQLSEEEQRLVINQAAEMPSAAMAVLYLLPEEPDPQTLSALRDAYGKIDGKSDEASQQFQIGIIAVLGESADDESMAFLREKYPNDPNKQAFLAMSLAQNPGGENWPLLIDALRVVEGLSAKMVLEALGTVDRVPEEPEAFRQAIIRGLEMGDTAQPSVDLLEHWSGEAQPGEDIAQQLAGWRKWFSLRWPEEPVAALPETRQETKWIYDELVAHVSNSDNIDAGSPHRGQRIFAEAQCTKCHRYGDVGDAIGPDLTNVTRRFRNKEILESIIYPSHVISDQYRAKTVITDSGKQYTGIVAAGAPGEVVILQQDGKKVVLDQEEIDETLPSRLSAMPEGLLDDLSLQEVTDLFTFLSKPPKTSTATRQDDE